MRTMLTPPGEATPYFNASTPLPRDTQRALRRGYYAAVSWADEKLGELLTALERLGLTNSTLVLANGDHGWHLGEHGHWCKEANTELATRVPLIVRDGRRAAGWGGGQHHGLVELVDIYRTVCELAGVAVQRDVDGRSFARHLLPAAVALPPSSQHRSKRSQPRASSSSSYLSADAAFSQYPRCYGEGEGGMVLCALGQSVGPLSVGQSVGYVTDDGYGQNVGYNEDTDAASGHATDLSAPLDVETHSWIDVMGLSVRVVGWRLTLWYPWDKARGAARFGVAPTRVPVELYAHPVDGTEAADLDATENLNLAGVPAHAAVQKALEQRLLDHFVPLARDARRHTARHHRGHGLDGGNSVEEQEGSQHEESQHEGGRPWGRWWPYSKLRASLRNESGKRLQHRRERGAMLEARRLDRTQRRTTQPGTALVPEVFAPERVAIEVSPE